MSMQRTDPIEPVQIEHIIDDVWDEGRLQTTL